MGVIQPSDSLLPDMAVHPVCCQREEEHKRQPTALGNPGAKFSVNAHILGLSPMKRVVFALLSALKFVSLRADPCRYQAKSEGVTQE
jgi:hypothetical protein